MGQRKHEQHTAKETQVLPGEVWKDVQIMGDEKGKLVIAAVNDVRFIVSEEDVALGPRTQSLILQELCIAQFY